MTRRRIEKKTVNRLLFLFDSFGGSWSCVMREETLDWLSGLGDALLNMLTQPLFYIGIVFIVLQVRRQIVLERRFFHVKLHALLPELWRMLLWGLGAGILASVAMGVIGVSFSSGAVIWMWAVTLVLLLFRVRFLCLAYMSGILGLLQGLLRVLPNSFGTDMIDEAFAPIREMNIPSLLALVGVLHIIEAGLVRWQGRRLASPMFFEGKRGKIVGGYQLQGFWMVPLFLLIPIHDGGGFTLPWVPLVAHDSVAGSWSWAGLPLMIGFTDWTAAMLPERKLRRSSARLFSYAALVLALAVTALWFPVLTLPTCIVSIGLHEVLIHWNRWFESKQSPFFIHGSQGLKILAVLPGSSAAEMGLQAGEIIHKVNQQRVMTKEELHAAMRINSAFCRMEVLNLDGHSKYVSRALFSNEHHQLGIILCPDDDAMWYMSEDKKETSVFAYLGRKWMGLSEQSSSAGHNG
jgi:hypothetical protein